MSEHTTRLASRVREAKELADRRLTGTELRAYLDAPVSDAERDEAARLMRRFTRRYPSPVERLAYARRAYARWTAGGR